MTAEQKMALFIAAARMAQAIADGAPHEILDQLHQDLGLLVDMIPAMPTELTDEAAARDQALIDAAEAAKF
jgi:hypothetical protein